MKMKKMFSSGMLCACLMSSVAMAGSVLSIPVTVTLKPDGSGEASGSMVTARFSDNDVEYLGCGVRRFSNEDDTYNWAFCQAYSADHAWMACYTEDPSLIEALASMGPYSFISFAWNAEGDCTHIGNSTSSSYIPAN